MSDLDQALSALDVALASAFNPAGSVSDAFTGLHAHYKVCGRAHEKMVSPECLSRGRSEGGWEVMLR